jgi:hypothetical protein
MELRLSPAVLVCVTKQRFKWPGAQEKAAPYFRF